MKNKFLFRLLLSALLVASFSSFTGHPVSNLSNDILAQTNKFRKMKGLPALILNDRLSAIAQRHSENMARGRVAFGHAGFAKRSREAEQSIRLIYSCGENVAYGMRSANEVMRGWKGSPGHRKNLLGNYKYIGIGIAKDRRGRLYFTQFFAG
jgi:uncharacterized protein YkwD